MRLGNPFLPREQIVIWARYAVWKTPSSDCVKQPLRCWLAGPGQGGIADDDPMAGWFPMGEHSLHVAQYAPRKRVSRKPRTPRRSLITVSGIVGPPHRVHSIAIFRLRLLSAPPTGRVAAAATALAAGDIKTAMAGTLPSTSITDHF